MKCKCICHMLPSSKFQCDECGCITCSGCGKITTIKQLKRKIKSCNCAYCFNCGIVVNEKYLEDHKKYHKQKENEK